MRFGETGHYAVLLGCLLGLIPAQQAVAACGCEKTPSLRAAFEQATLVVLGRIDSTTYEADGGGGPPGFRVQIKVESTFKGAAGPELQFVDLVAHVGCPHRYTEGKRWLFFARTLEHTPVVSNCSGSRRLGPHEQLISPFPDPADPLWQALGSLEQGALQTALEQLAPLCTRANPRKARVEALALSAKIRRASKLHGHGMGSLERGELAVAALSLQRVRKIPFARLIGGHYHDAPLTTALAKRAGITANRALQQQAWAKVLTASQTLAAAGETARSSELLALLETKARVLLDRERPLGRSKERTTLREAEQLLKQVLGMTAPRSDLHRKAKKRLGRVRRARAKNHTH